MQIYDASNALNRRKYWASNGCHASWHSVTDRQRSYGGQSNQSTETCKTTPKQAGFRTLEVAGKNKSLHDRSSKYSRNDAMHELTSALPNQYWTLLQGQHVVLEVGGVGNVSRGLIFADKELAPRTEL